MGDDVEKIVDRVMKARKKKPNSNGLSILANPKFMDKEAYKKFKTPVTNYGSGRTCSYGDKSKVCDPSCRFWHSCIKGRQRGADVCTE